MPTGIEGLEHAVTSNEVFDLPVFPRRLLVVGGGYIAVEFASLFQRLGVAGHDGHARAEPSARLRRGHAQRHARRDGERRRRLSVWLLPTAIEKKPDAALRVTLSDGSVLDADQALIATGRNPNTKDLGLEGGRRRAERRAWRGEGR